MKFHSFALSLVACLLVQAPASALPVEVDIGLKHMKAKNYKLAARYFYKAALDRPKDALVRYHLANSLVHLKRHSQAIKEYRRSYELDPYSVVSGYCKKALIAYKAALPVIIEGDGNPDTDTPAEIPPIEEENEAVTTIRRQVANEKSRHHQYASSLSENVIKAGDVAAKRIRNAAEKEINELLLYGPWMPAGTSMRRSGKPYSAMTPYEKKIVDQQIAEIRRQAEEDIKEEKDLAAERSRRIKRWSEDRKDSLDAVAENLEGQMKIESNPSGIKLNPVGTGLYVRNYQSSKGKRKLPETRYSVARFVDKIEDNEIKDNIEVNPAGKREEKVKGTIISNLVEPVR